MPGRILYYRVKSQLSKPAIDIGHIMHALASPGTFRRHGRRYFADKIERHNQRRTACKFSRRQPALTLRKLRKRSRPTLARH